MVYRDLVQLRLSESQRFYASIKRAIVFIRVWSVADKQVFNSDLIDSTTRTILMISDFRAIGAKGLKCMYRKQLLVVKTLLHRLSILQRTQPGVS